VTLPVGIDVPATDEVTFTLNATDCPKTLGFGVPVSAVKVVPFAIDWVNGAEFAGAKLPSPAYCAIRVVFPIGKLDVLRATLPAASREPLRIMLEPLVRLTVPVGMLPPSVVAEIAKVTV
jgi:hypothetical protein